MDPYYMAQQHGQPTDPATAAAKAAAAAAAAAAAHAAAAEAAGAALPFQMPHMPPGAPAYMHWPQQPMGLQPRAPPPPHMWNPYACMMPPAPVVSAPPYTALAGLTIPTRTRCSEREDASGRWVLEPEDVLLLERVFALEKCPGRELRAQLAARLHVKPRQIQVRVAHTASRGDRYAPRDHARVLQPCPMDLYKPITSPHGDVAVVTWR